MKKILFKTNKAYTITELLIALFLSSVIIVFLSKTFILKEREFASIEDSSEKDKNAAFFIGRMKQLLINSGSDPSPRIDSTNKYSPGWALGKLNDLGLSAKRGILPVSEDSFQILSYRPYDKNGDGSIGFDEGLCTSVTIIDSTHFSSSNPDCYSNSALTSTPTTYIPLKSLSEDNLKIYYADCDSDSVKDCIKSQNLGNYRTSDDDLSANVEIDNVTGVNIYYSLNDGRTVFYESQTATFNDGVNNDIAYSAKDIIKSVRMEFSLKSGTKIKKYFFTQDFLINF